MSNACVKQELASMSQLLEQDGQATAPGSYARMLIKSIQGASGTRNVN
jgi:hypothetical protein